MCHPLTGPPVRSKQTGVSSNFMYCSRDTPDSLFSSRHTRVRVISGTGRGSRREVQVFKNMCVCVSGVVCGVHQSPVPSTSDSEGGVLLRGTGVEAVPGNPPHSTLPPLPSSSGAHSKSRRQSSRNVSRSTEKIGSYS